MEQSTTSRFTACAIALACLTGLSGCVPMGGAGADAADDAGAEAASDIAARSTTTEADCGFPTTGLATEPVCYTVAVPENWADPDPERQVELRVAVFKATDPATAVDDPLIYLDGGPGGYTLDFLQYSADLLVEPYVGQRDVIVFDQRGVGRSEPDLTCDELNELGLEDAQGKVPADQVEEKTSAAIAACHDRLADDGVDFSAYHSVASASDVEAIRLGLGYEQVNLLGISYGTRLGQTLMRLYPASLRAVVLDSVMPVAADVQELIEVSGERSLRLVFEACASDPACSSEYPTFEQDYFALLDQLDAEPATVDVADLDGNEYTFVIDGDDLVGLTFGALYDKSFFSGLPQLVADAKEGNYNSIGTLARVNLINSKFFSDGMHYSVECHEEVPFESVDDLTANQPSDPPYNRLNVLDAPPNYFDICEQWQAGAAPAVENEPVSSDIPTLLLTGTFDPITPPSYAEQVGDHLSTSYLIEFPSEGHGVAPSECGAEIIAEFLDDPTSAPDASCVDGVDPPTWVVGGEAEINLVPFEVTQPIPYSGLRPEAWDEAADGTFARQQSMNDPTAVVIQPTAGTGPDLILPSAEAMLSVQFAELDPTDVDGKQWATYGVDDEGTIYRLLFDPDNNFVVIFAATADEFDQLFQTVAIPAAASLKTG